MGGMGVKMLVVVLTALVAVAAGQFGSDFRNNLKKSERPEFDCLRMCFRGFTAGEQLVTVFVTLVCVSMIKQGEKLLEDASKRWKNRGSNLGATDGEPDPPAELAVQSVLDNNPCKWDEFKKFSFDTSGMVESVRQSGPSGSAVSLILVFSAGTTFMQWMSSLKKCFYLQLGTGLRGFVQS